MPRYIIGEIPPQTIHHGAGAPVSPIRFDVEVPPEAALGCDVVPAPTGSITLQEGRFTYAPAPADTFDFTVTFTETAPDAEPRTQRVPFLPRAIPAVPEAELVAAQGPLPPEDSTDYITVSEMTSAEPRFFNKVAQHTRRVHVTGKMVVLDEASDANGLFTRLHGTDTRNSNIEEVVVYADTLRIQSPLRVPQANVTVFARRLVFTGSGLLDTTPAARDAAPQGTPQAEHGHPGGSVTLNVAELELGDPSIVRFRLRGGDGQAAGQGTDGADGADIALIPKGEARPGPVPPEAWDRMTYWEDARNIDGQEIADRVRVGDPGARPGNGADATPAGMPGDGGAGGELRTRVPVPQAQVDLSGGAPGARGDRRTGGDPGSPNPACHIRRIRFYRETEFKDMTRLVGIGTEYQVFNRLEAARGLDAEPLGPAAPGAAGGVTELPADGEPWLHPYAVQAVLAHARDAYVTGNLEVTRAILQAWREHLEAYRPPAELSPLAEQCRTEIETLIHRIDANRDYFGNPAGWVPMLSLEANFRNYENAVRTAMEVLYLAYWVQARAGSREAAAAALRQAVARADADVQAAAAEYRDLQRLIPQLQDQASGISRDLARAEAEIAAMEQRLLARARDHLEDQARVPFWKQALRVVSTACRVIPVYQPVLGSVGTGLELLSNIDTNAPLDTIRRVGDLSREFSAARFGEARADLDALVGRLNRRNAENNREYVEGLVKVGREFREALRKVQDATRATQVPQNELETELRRIEASDAEFQGLVARARDLAARRAEFARRLAQGLQTVGTFTDRLTRGVIAVNELNASLVDAAAQLDPRSLSQVRQMERGARETLLRFQYYLARAYEYRMLKPFPLDYRVNRTVERLRELASSQGKEPVLSEHDFGLLRGVYQEASRAAVVAAIDELQKRPPERSLPYSFGLSAAELGTLNRDNAVTIDLRTKIRELAWQENRRLSAVQFLTVEGEPGTPGADTANTTLTVEHQGVSVLRAGARFFRFDHRSGYGYPPFTWQANYDAVQQTFKEGRVSDAALSRLRALLDISASDAEMTMFAAPGADAEVVIRKEATTAESVRITRLRLSVDVEFLPAGTGNVLLTVRTADGLEPYITCSTPDEGLRKDGRGTFTRLYPEYHTVTLEAPAAFAGLHFQRWADEGGAELTAQAALTLTLQASRVVQAVYAPPADGTGPAQPAGAPKGITQGERLPVERIFIGPEVEARFTDATLAPSTPA
jgi:hypothetical protein